MNFRPLYILPIILLFGAVVVVRTHRAAPLAVEAGDWRTDVLAGVGNTEPSQDTLTFLSAWHRAEGGTAAFNWLNSTEDAPGATDYNSVGVKNYPDYQTGVDATVRTLMSDHPGYAEIVTGLQANDPDRAQRGLAASPWGSSAGLVADVRREDTRVEPPPRVSSSAGIRVRVIQIALAQVGKGYILGSAGPNTFDCSGLVHWVYAQQGIETGRVTQDQLRQLRPIEANQVQPGDLIYFQFSWDQHTGILADVNGDGKWDMINAGTPQIGVVITDNVFGDPFWTNAIIGYRSAL